MFDRAQLRRSIEIDLAGDAALLLVEAIVFGRTAMGEAVEHGHLFDRWRVRRDGRLVFAETTRLDGGIAERLAQTAVAKDGCAVASVLVAPGDDALASAIRSSHFLGEFGVSAWNGLALARLVARDGDMLRHDVKAILAALGVDAPRLWLN